MSATHSNSHATTGKAAAYYRMSTERQEASIPDQREAVERHAARNGYTILREYMDEGISGDDTERRAGFQQMLRDAKERADFEVILCWDQDRFGRFDPLEAGYWIKPLRDVGVRLETVAQGRIDWDDFAGRIIYAVQQEGKHAFLRDLSRNTTRGKLKAAKEGKWNGGAPPYGYAIQNQRLVPGSAEKVVVVKELFDNYAYRGMSLRYLTHDLNARGILSPTGKKWCIQTVRSILTNPLYCGNAVWNRRHEGMYHGVAGGSVAASARGRK